MDAGTLELVELDDLLDADCQCELGHVTTLCTVSVVAVLHSRGGCDRDRMVCQAIVDHVNAPDSSYRPCGDCLDQGRHIYAADCWQIRPI